MSGHRRFPGRRPDSGNRRRTALQGALVACLPALAGADVLSAQEHSARARATEMLASQPMAFVENLGQWPDAVRFFARRGPAAAWFVDGGFVATFERDIATITDAPPGAWPDAAPPARTEGVALRMTFEGAASRPRGELRLPGERNYFTGADPRRWARGVRAFARVGYDGVYPGVDVVVRDNGRFLEYDLRLSPSADLDRVVVRCEGIDGLRLADDGRLIFDTAVGEVSQTRPISWCVRPDGTRDAVPVSFRILGDDRYGFRAPSGRPALPLVIDPGLDWSTYVGSGGDETMFDVGLDANGLVTVAGASNSPAFPTTAGAFQQLHAGANDAVVTRLDPNATGPAQLVWSTFVGGGSDDVAFELGVDQGSGVTTLAGYTDSSDFPTTANAYQATSGGAADAFVAQLDPLGSSLVYSTYIGGPGADWAAALDVSPGSQVATVGGYTGSPAFPTTAGAYSTTYNGGTADAFVLCLSTTVPPPAQLLWSTFLGGSLREGPLPPVAWRSMNYLDLYVDTSGVVTIGGMATSLDFPTTPGALQTTYGGGFTVQGGDAFVTRLDPLRTGAQQLLYSSYYGGGADDTAIALKPHPEGGVVFCGRTWSTDLQTSSGAYSGASNGQIDGMIVWLDPSQSGVQQLRYGTYFGGPGFDELQGLDIERSGIVTACGIGQQFIRMTAGAFQRSTTGAGTGVVCRLAMRGNGRQDMHYASYVGGPSTSFLQGMYAGVVLDDRANAILCGRTGSASHPTTPGAYQGSLGGQTDAVVVRLDMLPSGADRYGVSTPACAYPIYTGVSRWPKPGTSSFALLATGAPPSAAGAVFFGLRSNPYPLANIQVLLAPIVLGVSSAADPLGHAELNLPLASSLPAGVQLAVQWVFLTTPACPGSGLVGASDGINLTTQ